MLVPDGIEHIEHPSTMFYSPRIPNPYDDQIKVGDSDNSERIKVYYATETNSYKNIYEFIFACRASKLTDNYYLMGSVPTSVANLKARAILLGNPQQAPPTTHVIAPSIYNIVSGDKLDVSLSEGGRLLVHRYMMMGLHYFAMYSKCGLGRTRVLLEQTQSRIVSAGGHLFDETQGWLLNVSNIFIGMLIDYYRIESGIVGMNAQLSFAKEPEFRFLVYKYLKAVFVAFLKHNEQHIDPSKHTLSEATEQTEDSEIISRAAKLLNTLETSLAVSSTLAR